MTTRQLVLLILSAALAFSVSACCCGDTSEWQKQLDEKMGKAGEASDDEADEADKGDEADKDDKDDDDSDKKDKKKSSKGGAKVADMDGDSIIAAAEGEGWKKVAAPNVTDSAGVKTVVVTFMKGSMVGSVMLYKASNAITIDALEKGFENQDAASSRDGKNLLVVLVTGHKDEAKDLLKALTK
jgi:hypothetical protein